MNLGLRGQNFTWRGCWRRPTTRKSVEEHGIPLLGEKQGVPSENQDFEGQVEESHEEEKRARQTPNIG